MKRIVVALFGFALLLGMAGSSRGQILINEIMADPASDWSGDSTYSYRDDEWVEVYNAGSEPVDLSTYWLSDADSTLLYNFSGGLGPRRHRVILGADAVVWQRANGRSAVGLRLNNTGDTVILWKTPPVIEGTAGLEGRRSGQPEPMMVDSYVYSSHEAEDDRSTGRLPDGEPSWVLFDGMNPYTGSQEPQGEGCMPTPGGSNGCATPAEDRSWGAIKILYR